MLPVPGHSLDCSWYSRNISSIPRFAPQISDKFSKPDLHVNFSVIEDSPSEWLLTHIVDSFMFKDLFY